MQLAKNNFVIQVLDNDNFYLWDNTKLDIQELAKEAIVYKYLQRKEYLFAKDSQQEILKPDNNYSSAFSIPTFSDLRDALHYYKVHMVRKCSCLLLTPVWYDKNRLFLKNAQEHNMRDSLAQFLKSTMRATSVEVRPEQTVDTSHPVDIKVTWTFTNRLALIEIKWLGTPKYEDGHLGSPYGEPRARAGAKQLAEYLDANVIQAPGYNTKGYLVIIDGRRTKLKENSTEINFEEGFYYSAKKIKFNPEYHKQRSDFEEPICMFVEPIIS